MQEFGGSWVLVVIANKADDKRITRHWGTKYGLSETAAIQHRPTALPLEQPRGHLGNSDVTALGVSRGLSGT